MFRSVFPIAAATVLLALGGCEGKAPSPAPSETADATPENAPGISVGQATVQLPVIAGRPGAAYFEVSQGSGPPRRIVRVDVAGAGRAELHQTMDSMPGSMSSMKPVSGVLVEPGKTVRFAPGGMHVMVYDLARTLKAGDKTELTLTFDNGDKASVPATVTTVGNAGSAH
jgi:copper(I)-binding protein